MRFFNTSGPVVAADHYCMPPLERIDRRRILSLIGDKRYFVLHAPRQTGKTSALLALVDELNGSGAYRCVYVNVERGQSAREDVAAGMRAILNAMARKADATLEDRFPAEIWPEVLERAGPHDCLAEVLERWAAADPKPLVLLQAFLQRVVNSGGRVEREYGLGRMRTDLQTRAYMDRCAAAEGHLVLFDRSAGKSWSEKVFRRTETAAGSPPVTVWACKVVRQRRAPAGWSDRSGRVDMSSQTSHLQDVNITFSTYQAKARFSEVMRMVRAGKTVAISYRGDPVAEIRPLEQKQQTIEDRLEELERRGILVRSGGVRKPLVAVAHIPGALDRFLSERGE